MAIRDHVPLTMRVLAVRILRQVVAALLALAMVPPMQSQGAQGPVVDQWQMLWGAGWPQSINDRELQHRRYTHLGGDWGLMGLATQAVTLRGSVLEARVPQKSWVGVWHSLSGLQSQALVSLDAAALWPWTASARWQARWTALRLKARGQGQLKLEILNAAGAILWSAILQGGEGLESWLWTLPLSKLHQAKTLNWVAEGGSHWRIESLELGIDLPDLGLEHQVLAVSLGKLFRCAPREGGWFRDRAHWPDGAMASVSSTGLAVLAAVACSQPPLEVVNAKQARAWFDAALHDASRIKRACGLLPHFVQGLGETQRIHPGTEYSTVDSALFFQAMLLAAEILGDAAAQAQLKTLIGQIRPRDLWIEPGWYGHGLLQDGRTLLPHAWADWGGETVLVNALMAMADGSRPQPARQAAEVWQGVGFIAEIQSLLHPDFESSLRDALDAVDWLNARRALLAQQRAAILHWWPQSQAADIGAFGLSAGEAIGGDAYRVHGSKTRGGPELHPHYMLMSWALGGAQKLLPTLGAMQSRGWLAAWGMAECVSVQNAARLPMQGSLNAAFEALGAYHALSRLAGFEDLIYRASLRNSLVRKSLRWYFPP